MSTSRTAILTLDGKTFEFPVMTGVHGNDVIDIRTLGAKTGMFTYDTGYLSTAHQSPKFMVFKFQQARQRGFAHHIQCIAVIFPKMVENQIKFQHGAPAMPFQAIDARPAIFAHRHLAREPEAARPAGCAKPAVGREPRSEELIAIIELGDQTARLTIISLILPIALVGFKPLGQTSTQFMMVWQRNRR